MTFNITDVCDVNTRTLAQTVQLHNFYVCSNSSSVVPFNERSRVAGYNITACCERIWHNTAYSEVSHSERFMNVA